MPKIRGCGIADVTSNAFSYKSLSFFVFFCAVYICISIEYTSKSCVPLR